MRTFVIGNENCVLGFRLVGVQGVVARTAEHLHTALRDALDHPEIALVLVTSDVANLDRERMDELKISSTRTLVVEIPGQGEASAYPSLTEFVQKAVGISLGG